MEFGGHWSQFWPLSSVAPTLSLINYSLGQPTPIPGLRGIGLICRIFRTCKAMGLFLLLQALASPGLQRSNRETCEFTLSDNSTYPIVAANGRTVHGGEVYSCAAGCTCQHTVSSNAGASFAAEAGAHAVITCPNTTNQYFGGPCNGVIFSSGGSLVVNCLGNACTQSTFRTLPGGSVTATCSGDNSCGQAKAFGGGVQYHCTGPGSCSGVNCNYWGPFWECGQPLSSGGNHVPCPVAQPPRVTVSGCSEHSCNGGMGLCQSPEGTLLFPNEIGNTYGATTPAPGGGAAAGTVTPVPAGSHPSGACPGSVGSQNGCHAWCGPSNFRMWQMGGFQGSGGNTGGFTCTCSNNNACTFGSGGSVNNNGGVNIGGSVNTYNGDSDNTGGNGGKGGSSSSESVSISGGAIAAIVLVIVAIGGFAGYRYWKMNTGEGFTQLDESTKHENSLYDGNSESGNQDTMSAAYAEYQDQ